MTVTSKQLKERAEAMEARWHYFKETADRQKNTLKLHETWRQEYASFPYLLGAPDDRIASRFKDVFINQTELDSSAKVGLLPIGMNMHLWQSSPTC